MKLATFIYEGKEQIGILTDDCKGVVPASLVGCECSSMNQLIEQYGKDKIAELGMKAKQSSNRAVSLSSVKLQAPIPRPMQDVLCVGRNYIDHIKEGARFRLEDFDLMGNPSVYFSKRVNRATAPGDAIDSHSDMEDQLDYESELAVIISKDAYKVKAEDAADYVFGYTIVNDVSARKVQNAHKQWYFGKSLDGFTPMGPWIVTSDEFSFPPQMTVQSRVNGELRQNSTTDMMIYDIPYIIQELTSGMTLLAGTVIATGTPSGVGMGFVPPRFLKSGDVVECTVSGIGTLRNTIV